MLNFFTNILKIIKLNNIDKKTREIVFYSEGSDSWLHLKPLIQEFFKKFDRKLFYITSSKNDLGLDYKNDNLVTFVIDNVFARNWIISNLEANFLIMTTPDLNKFGFNKSLKVKNHVYVQHSLCSMHMIYREKAFNFYDIILCNGDYQVKEIEEIIKIYKLKKIRTIKYGYPRIENIKKNLKLIETKIKFYNDNKVILIAPSWGENCIIESFGSQILNILIEKKYNVILRPHPRTILLNINKINKIKHKFKTYKNFYYDDNPESELSFFSSDLMISDWSGVAYEYGFATKKPIIFIDTLKKINNLNYQNLKITPFEVYMRYKLGVVINKDNIENIDNIIKTLNNSNINSNDFIYDYKKNKDNFINYLKEYI